MMFVFASICWGRPSIEVRPQSVVETEGNVRLGQIANLVGFDAPSVQIVKEIIVLTNLASANSRVLNSDDLSRKILRQIASQGDIAKLHPQLKIPKQVQIQNQGAYLSKEKVQASLLEQVQKMCADCTFDVKDINVPMIKQFSKDYKWELKVGLHLPQGAFTLPLEIENQGKKQVYWIIGFLTVYRSVPVLNRTLKGGDRIQEEDYQFIKRDVTYSRQTVPTSKELIGAELNRTIVASDIIWKNDLRRELAVRAGQVTKVIIGSDDFQVAVLAEAKQSGYVGDMISLLNVSTKKVITGEIVSKGVVAIK